ncbi:hypothetical protein [Thalassovita sp.]|uniref:hypothetical protein n=1 Tax=Thalassovita sp. TaxID=1979401 RepID=UPI002B27AE73|nr:hypothetical protein [Thalassovita sp.]
MGRKHHSAPLGDLAFSKAVPSALLPLAHAAAKGGFKPFVEDSASCLNGCYVRVTFDRLLDADGKEYVAHNASVPVGASVQ